VDLHLVRHAVAWPHDPDRWPDDSLRPLTPEGIDRFRRAARGLRRVVRSVDLVLASPFPRAWHTAELLSEEAGWPTPVRCEALEAGRDPMETLNGVRPHLEAAGAAALVGHEPNLGQVASTLLTGRSTEVRLDLRKGGALCLRLEGTPPAEASTLRWLLTPKVLRSLAK
jgi:phosphohistidine phosphatase